jgi:hypothetical protein
MNLMLFYEQLRGGMGGILTLKNRIEIFFYSVFGITRRKDTLVTH